MLGLTWSSRLALATTQSKQTLGVFFFLCSFVVVNEIGATHRGFACGLFRGDAESTSLDIGPGAVPIDPAR